MRDRWFSKKDAKGAYDPQVGQAAAANQAVAARAQDWNEKFYTDNVAPVLAQMNRESEINIGRQGEIFDLNMAQARQAADRYKTLGVPAEDRYYQMVKDYSSPEEQEKQARAAIGDVRVAQQNQEGQLARRFRSLAVDPTSPAVLSARTDAAVQNAATEAAAATRARDAAKVLGMSLTSDAANFGRGGFANTAASSAAAGGAASAGLSGATGAAGTAPGGASNVNAGLNTAAGAYGNNLSAYAGLNRASMEMQGQAYAGLGSAIGGIAGAATGTGGIKQFFGSDRRIKKHATRLMEWAHGIGVWAFRYLWDDDRAPLRYGFMADEVEPVLPHAVRTVDGFKQVDYNAVLVA